ncbi:MAG TPA: hypothetical protein VGA36_09700 [Nitriliruptorales bacterium]
MTPVLLLAIAGLVAFLATAAWSVRSSKQPLSSIDSFSRALEAMEPSVRDGGRGEPADPLPTPASSPHDDA